MSMPAAPTACAITERPRRRASPTATATSSTLSCGCCAASTPPNTPPEVQTLTQSAPARRTARTTCRICSGPSTRNGGQEVLDREGEPGPGKEAVGVASGLAQHHDRDVERGPCDEPALDRGAQ